MVKFIHAADLHLDSPFNGLHAMPERFLKKVRHSTFDAMERLTEAAINRQVDFVVLSGDIYDYEDRSIKAQSFFRHQMEKLNACSIPVYLIHGNHDYITENAVQLNMPENVKIFDVTPETVVLQTKTGGKVFLTGFSYGQKWVKNRMIEKYPTRRPEADFHIGLLHGFFEGGTDQHAQYAPFTVGELKSKGYDYWALGHIHKRQCLSESPLIFYSGNIQGRNKKETGEKGFLLVELTDSGNQVEFIPASKIQWENISINASTVDTLDGVYQLVEKKIRILSALDTNLVVTFTVTLPSNIDENLLRKLLKGELLAAFQQEKDDSPFIWVNDIRYLMKDEEKRHSIASAFEEEWEQSLEEMKNEKVLSSVLEDFYRNASVSGVLPLQEDEYREEILQEAIRIIHSAVGGEE